jgi:predicted nucleic acid-binding protein
VSEIFADSFYWIALANPADQWHQMATNFSQTNTEAMLITTDEVLSEFLNYYSAAGEPKRAVVANMFEETMNHPRVLVLPQTRESLLRGFAFYKERADKGYSLTDCISMTTMHERNISEVLTHDHHFTQEGFTPLF